jgi:D-alanyl-D-alanine carboxypeptidase/D-alanyl-D-alanine-endopeptidase (penicillin-binding protein 4)
VTGRVRIPGEAPESPGVEEGSGVVRPVLQELAAVPSPPVSVRVREMMKASDNLHAQLLLLGVGSRTKALKEGLQDETTDAAGLRAMDQFLARVGLRRTEYFFEEGSGLSRKNVVTPHAVVQLLMHMNRHPSAKEWRDSLPVGGVDGTLKSRFTTAPTKGNVRAKTGSLRHVAALSGYVTTLTGEPLAFSILVNQYIPDGQGSARREIDELVQLLAGFQPRPE